MKRILKIRTFAVMLLVITMSVVLCSCGSSVLPSDITGVDSLPGKIIGTQLGTTGDIYASDYIELGSEIKQYNKGADAVMALKQGKVDCVIIDSEPAKKFIALNSDLSILDEEFANESYAICVSKENEELLKSINSALSELQNNGTIDSIISNYIGDETGKTPYISPENTDRSNGTLIMATNAGFEPYEYDEGGVVVGIDPDIVQAIADILGKELVIQDMEFDSIITAVQSGKADIGAAGMTITEDRLKNINFTDPYTNAKQVIIVRNGSNGAGQILKEKFYQNFISKDRWQYITNGLFTTLRISFFAVIIGVVLGFLLAVVRFTCDKNDMWKPVNALCKLYITIIRGTPAMIQLLIIYYVVFASSDIDAVIVATIAFGLNSSAYIAEIVRAGIASIDNGQFEAGRSLGFSYVQTMRYFILPQAIRNILPALGNEFIVLLKETSISGYIGIRDLTRGGDLIRSRTYDAFMPLMAVAVIYLFMVVILSKLVARLERRLNNERK